MGVAVDPDALVKDPLLDKNADFIDIEARNQHRREVIPIAYIEVSDDEPLEKAIKRFKRQVEKEGIIREWKKREFFEKPSAILNRKKKALERKRMKRARKVSADEELLSLATVLTTEQLKKAPVDGGLRIWARRDRPCYRMCFRNRWVRSSCGEAKTASGGPRSMISPLSMKTTVCAAARAKPISWETTSMVMPSFASSTMTSSTSLIISGSSAEVGSSKSMTLGLMARARAMATRCCWPPESCSG